MAKIPMDFKVRITHDKVNKNQVHEFLILLCTDES